MALLSPSLVRLRAAPATKEQALVAGAAATAVTLRLTLEPAP